MVTVHRGAEMLAIPMNRKRSQGSEDFEQTFGARA